MLKSDIGVFLFQIGGPRSASSGMARALGHGSRRPPVAPPACHGSRAGALPRVPLFGQGQRVGPAPPAATAPAMPVAAQGPPAAPVGAADRLVSGGNTVLSLVVRFFVSGVALYGCCLFFVATTVYSVIYFSCVPICV